jgi:hypothetical protein
VSGVPPGLGGVFVVAHVSPQQKERLCATVA